MRFRVNLHTHTTFSDGKNTPKEMVEAYKKLGYGAVAITDHDVFTPPPDVEGITVLQGCEHTTSNGKHIEHWLEIRGEKEPPLKIKAHPNRWGDTCLELQLGVQQGLYELIEACYDDETEVLTLNGWKNIDSLTTSDLVYTLNPKTKKVELEHPKRVVKLDWDGYVLVFDTYFSKLRVTPNHNLFVAFHYFGGDYYPYVLVPAKEAFGRQFKFFKNGAIWSAKEVSEINVAGRTLPMNLWLKFFGYWLAEGHTYINRDLGTYQTGFRNSNKEILNDFITVSEAMGFKVSRKNSTQVVICDKELTCYLSKFGRSYERYIPLELKMLPPNQLSILLDAYLKCDG